ncbi:YciI family protein [Streptomyces sp. NPDC020996]|uniref:YciI family protein n=1 Tax=Streptomyces sp. NPDC020996 TaxID=3154791 RepID=UPI0033D22F6F
MTTQSLPHNDTVFVLTVTYNAPLKRVDELLQAHREWLDTHFSSGLFLASGPRVPRTGGVILARAADRAEVEALILTDPFVLGGVADYDIVQFQPSRGPFATSLVTGTTAEQT